MKVLLDTNVYVTACRSEAQRQRFRDAFLPLLPATYLSAVVAYELSVNALDVGRGSWCRTSSARSNAAADA